MAQIIFSAAIVATSYALNQRVPLDSITNRLCGVGQIFGPFGILKGSVELLDDKDASDSDKKIAKGLLSTIMIGSIYWLVQQVVHDLSLNKSQASF